METRAQQERRLPQYIQNRMDLLRRVARAQKATMLCMARELAIEQAKVEYRDKMAADSKDGVCGYCKTFRGHSERCPLYEGGE